MTWNITVRSHSSDSQPQSNRVGVNRQVNTYHQIDIIYVSSGCSDTQAKGYE